MKPKILYHGSNRRIRVLIPKEPFVDLKENSMKAIFATSNKDLAIAMGLTNQKNSVSFCSRNKVLMNFVKGIPKMKYVYLHYLKSRDFKHNRNDEYISIVKVKPFKTEKFAVKDLGYLWRKSDKMELKQFLKDRNKWNAPVE
jgi:hypothetical protein